MKTDSFVVVIFLIKKNHSEILWGKPSSVKWNWFRIALMIYFHVVKRFRVLLETVAVTPWIFILNFYCATLLWGCRNRAGARTLCHRDETIMGTQNYRLSLTRGQDSIRISLLWAAVKYWGLLPLSAAWLLGKNSGRVIIRIPAEISVVLLNPSRKCRETGHAGFCALDS